MPRAIKRKEIPPFANEDEERDFWASHDSADCIDGLGHDHVKRRRLASPAIP